MIEHGAVVVRVSRDGGRARALFSSICHGRQRHGWAGGGEEARRYGLDGLAS